LNIVGQKISTIFNVPATKWSELKVTTEVERPNLLLFKSNKKNSDTAQR